MILDVPDQVRKTVIADGNESWLDELPGVVASLAQEWSLMVGSSFAGGHAALVVEATLVDGTPAVLKIGVPAAASTPAVLAFSPLAICCWPKRIASRRSHRIVQQSEPSNPGIIVGLASEERAVGADDLNAVEQVLHRGGELAGSGAC